MGVATGCGWKEVYRFPQTTYPYSSCICSFLQQHPYFLFILKMFFVLVQYFFVITFYVYVNGRPAMHLYVTYALYFEIYTTLIQLMSIAGYEAYVCVCFFMYKTVCAAFIWLPWDSRGSLYVCLYCVKKLFNTGPASLEGQRSRTRRRSQCMPRRLRLRVPMIIIYKYIYIYIYIAVELNRKLASLAIIDMYLVYNIYGNSKLGEK